jgi:hypothetical protein
MKHKHPLQAAIAIRPGFVLDPNPAHGHRSLLQTYDVAKRELRSAIGNDVTMAALRALIPVTMNPAQMTDDDVLDHVARMVGNAQASLKFSSTDAGTLPWPDILKDLKRFEGVVLHMYLDTVGKVTVGAGTMLASKGEAEGLKWSVRKTKMPATAAEIDADYVKVQGQKWGMLPSKYVTDLDFTDDVDGPLKARAEESADAVAARYMGWANYPVEVKRVLIDMRYNMKNNMDKFKTFQAAIEKAAQTKAGADWKAAAEASNRPQVNDDRNDWTYDMILKGGGVPK